MPRRTTKPTRGVYEKEPGSDIWWIRYKVNGVLHREKVGRKGDAGDLYEIRKADALRGVKLPLNLKQRGIRFKEIGEDAVAWYENHGQKDLRSFRLRMNMIYTDFADLVFLENGDLWGNSGSGVFRIGQEEVAKSGHGDHAPLRARLFDYLDGLTGIPGATDWGTSATLAPNGKLYVLANGEFEWIDPLHLPENPLPPKVLITCLSVGDQSTNPAPASIRLHPDTRNLEISYTATSLLIPERVRFRYRLIGFDRDWVDAGTRRQALYAKLPAGNYTFQVIACNGSGVWNQSGATLKLAIPPTFLETVWFKIGVVVIFTAIVLLLFRMRLEQARRRSAERAYELFADRERIARDLHDTFLQSVQAVNLSFHTATGALDPASPEHARFVRILEQSDEVMLQGRDMVFALRTVCTSGLSDAVRGFVKELQSVHTAKYTFEREGHERELAPMVCEELFKIIREALWNAFRHAQAHEVKVLLRFRSDGLVVEVSDDGEGIPPSILQEGRREGHWGLPGMRERAKQIGAQFDIISDSEGTKISLSIPLDAAYSAPRRPWFRTS
ncbi:ATP-binding protein [Silvibacterium acidisoli]|uniref:ATP-binding protein n=1 Tax=Acidobacteriaceae bacterium ZG23-2 TaxID=2883246 RepID=UPI00406D116F